MRNPGCSRHLIKLDFSQVNKGEEVMKQLKIDITFTALLTVALLAGCGDGAGTNMSGSSGNTTVGVVTANTANQITVSGKTFNTTTTTVSGDGVTNVNDIQTGMVVVVQSDDSGNAESIDYDVEVKGIVESIGTDVMLVSGQSIDITHSPVFVSEMAGITDINSIPSGALVEISGYSDGMGNIVATYIKLEDHFADESDDLELEGIVTMADTVNGTFMIGDQLIHYDPASINFTLEDGQNVEVEIVMDTSGDLHATEIEIEDEHGDDDSEGHEVEMTGIITGGITTEGSFVINGETVILSNSAEFEDGLSLDSIVDGAILEVKGFINEDGILVVTEIELPL